MNFDHILLIGFGGPEKPEEVRPFLESVTRGVSIPEERLREVERHYQAVGGQSPYNESVFRFSHQLREKLFEKSIALPMFVGMRHWHPFLKDTLAEIHQKGFKHGIGMILAPHRSEASYEKYIRAVEEAKDFRDVAEMEYQYLNPWHDHPGFIEAQAEEAEKILALLPEAGKNISILFTAHSIPLEMAERSKYAEEVTRSSELVAQQLGVSKWQVAWQSRSGNPKQPWLAPDVLTAIRNLKQAGERGVLLVPIGFLCDNVEILYDLDIEARAAASKLGMKYLRARTVLDHPKVAAMFAELIQDMFVGFRC